jgi:small-conductance mechanosensitive channel
LTIPGSFEIKLFIMDDILSRVYYNNTAQDYLMALGIIVGGIVALALFRKVIFSRLKKWADRTENTLDDFAVRAIEKFGLPALNFVILYVGINYLTLSEKANQVIRIAVAVIVTFFILRLLSTTALQGLQSYVRRQDQGEEKVKQLGGIMLILNIIIWSIGIIFLFDNLGYDVGTIIAGLGIGGIAIALAAQNILGDLFNYFVIFFDRPFEIGDFIEIDDKKGNVEHIGIKTTRLKSLTGEQLILSNSDLTKSRLHNFKRMQRRRIEFKIGVTYEATLEQIQKIPTIIKDIISSIEGITLDRTHFMEYGEYSIVFQTVYFVENADYNVYMDIHQTINLRLFEEFEKRGIELAYRTQSVFLIPTEKENSKQQLVSQRNP